MMNEHAKSNLEKAGWKIGDASEFLDLSPDEESFVELKLALSKAVLERRKQLHLTQTQVARRMGTGQSRIARMEAAEETVSLDFMVRSLLAMGASRREVAKAIA